MVYSFDCHESRFRISKPRAALAASKAANRKRPLFDFEEIPARLEAAGTVNDALQVCCWDVEADENGDVGALFYEGKLLTTFDDFVLGIDSEDGQRVSSRFQSRIFRDESDTHLGMPMSRTVSRDSEEVCFASVES